MSRKRKISIRKVLQAFVTLIVTSGCLVAVFGASRLQQQKPIRKIFLNIKNENKYQFLDKQQLWHELVVEKNIKVNSTRLNKLDVMSIEKCAYLNPWVAAAEVYMDNTRNIHINVTQRIPVARIFMENGESRYLDTSLHLLPLSDQFTYYTAIVTNVPLLGNDSLSRDMKAQVVKLVQFIERDSFWNAQIEQIMVTTDRKFELIPTMGNHKILIGDTADLKSKFNNLFAFYKKVLNRIGWDKYEVLDVRFAGQVVASPSLPWKSSSKNAMSNMDWVKSIIGTDSKNDSAKITQGITIPRVTPAKPIPVVPAPAAIAVPHKPEVKMQHTNVKVTPAGVVKKETHTSAAPIVNKEKKGPNLIGVKPPVKSPPAKTIKKEPPKEIKKEIKKEVKKEPKKEEKKEEKKKKVQPQKAAKYIYQGNANH